MHVVVATSGGVDSATAIGMHLKAGDQVTAVTLDYGQLSVREIHAAQEVTTWYNQQRSTTHPVEHIIIGASGLGPALSWKRAAGIPLSALAPLDPSGDEPTIAITPNRNMIIASIAGGIAWAGNASEVVLGIHAGRPGYPDCTPVFLDTLTALRSVQGMRAPASGIRRC
jgi:7-cyano-7-deazaguanine synthase in queuosine biosynthesis